MDTEALKEAAKVARGLSMDAVAKAASGHLGLPLGATEIGAVLFGHALSFHPKHPRWINRDRFVLSAGHGSMFLYSWLHLSGFDLSLEEVKNFRQLHSKTPGHPEFEDTPGVECTTGPLGQGVGNAVGMAVAGKMAAARFNTAEHTLFDYHVVALAGDGCLQEGVSAEAASFAGHHGLDNLILFYDSNDVTLDAAADKTQSEDTARRFEAYGFDVQTIDGHDMQALLRAYQKAKKAQGKPQFIIARTQIGRGIPEVAGTFKAHGEAGVKFVAEARKAMGLPEERFYVSDAVRTYFKEHQGRLDAAYKEWLATFKAWKSSNPDAAAQIDEALERVSYDAEALLACIPEFDSQKPIATRSAGSTVLQPLAQKLPLFLSGSADLHGSTKNYIKDAGDFSPENPTGRNLYWGIREHGMGAIMNGISYDGLLRASGATFLTFSDYMRPSIRLAALSKLDPIYIFTHDSIGVGEDGPTHQPVEMVASLRAIPNLDVIRPGDAEETAGAFVAAMSHRSGPTALILSRQNLPVLEHIPLQERRKGVLKGGYIAHKETGTLELILMATGSELHLALEAAQKLGSGVRVLSMPCLERFERLSDTEKETLLPSSCTRRLCIEAGATQPWYRYAGSHGKVLGVDRFGLSAPGDTVFNELGIHTEAILQAASAL